ncbi:MAG: hypothetical protein JSW38_06170 [Dehalococcoidia bacterium]|nr:MAG: hypothetical protein JSW38_06170 [Dehalococcoidia bacterium]
MFIVGCQSNTDNSDKNDPTPVIVGVDDVAADPFAYVGPIAIEGVVSFVYPSNSTFVIIDVKEYELCGVVTCAINEIPITVPPDSFTGTLPEVKDVVLTYGEIISSDNEFYVEVSQVRRDGKTILQKLEQK